MVSQTHSLAFLKRVLNSLLPRFLISGARNENNTNKAPKQTRFTRLDGLRGVAAFVVFTSHTLYGYDNIIFYGDGAPDHIAEQCGIDIDANRYNDRSRFMQLPFIRLLYAGSPAVAIFFIISGFVLTQKPLRLAREQRWDDLLISLSSAAFRRPFRLLLMLTVATFNTMILTHWDLFDGGVHDETCLVPVFEPAYPVARNFLRQLLDWLLVVWRIINVWDWSLYHPAYDYHLWTISTELRASMAIFLVTLAFCRLRSGVRLAILSILIPYSLIWIRWDMGLFLSGMLFTKTS